MVPAQYKVLYSPADIAREVKRMGQEISTWCAKVWEESHTDVIAIPVLRGGVFLLTDLVREIDRSVEIVPARTWAYEVGQNAVERSEVTVDLGGVPAQGRHVLLVDDICDSGKTLKTLSAALIKMGALEVKSAVLIRRKIEHEIVVPDYVAFNYTGPEWFVGYGMEDAERWRNLPSVCIIRQGDK